ncbi:hypothetical protein HU200_001369 [Digitaria exilis]|uniref:Uncharacterized protein n=1 Tax=Digitaria exilis TaxID=1010633 RepID=A0A835KW05_9POAL|nr:hypothetical protein HU200_001369 [Digitaria exilis]
MDQNAGSFLAMRRLSGGGIVHHHHSSPGTRVAPLFECLIALCL